jgi:hypothetical protein
MEFEGVGASSASASVDLGPCKGGDSFSLRASFDTSLDTSLPPPPPLDATVLLCTLLVVSCLSRRWEQNRALAHAPSIAGLLLP